MVGKFASILGPLLMALVPVMVAGANERDAILVLILLFVGGGLLLFRVDTRAGIEAARQLEQE